MGQKIRPNGIRVGITRNWNSRWYASRKEFPVFLVQDYRIRQFLKAEYGFAGISHIEIERTRETVRVIIHSARPGVIIGRKGVELEKLRDRLKGFIAGEYTVDIKEIAKPEMDSQLVAESIGEQLAKRAAYRRVMKKSIQMARQCGAEGIKIIVSGRLGGSDIARVQKFHEGSIPLSTLKANIDYGFAESRTSFGIIGVKVWIYKGLVDRKEAVYGITAKPR
ncbi:MAG: 30S ribosomal protein S3 [Planctomycetota bacterium]